MSSKNSKLTSLKPPFVIKLKRERDFDEADVDAWIDSECETTPSKDKQRYYVSYSFVNINDAFRFKLHWVRS